LEGWKIGEGAGIVEDWKNGMMGKDAKELLISCSPFFEPNIPLFQHSNIPLFLCSIIPIFHHSVFPLFQYSILPIVN